jgi:hypothetical protein
VDGAGILIFLAGFLAWSRFYQSLMAEKLPGANPTITSYNAGVVKIYNGTYSIRVFRIKNDCFLL